MWSDNGIMDRNTLVQHVTNVLDECLNDPSFTAFHSPCSIQNTSVVSKASIKNCPGRHNLDCADVYDVIRPGVDINRPTHIRGDICSKLAHVHICQTTQTEALKWPLIYV